MNIPRPRRRRLSGCFSCVFVVADVYSWFWLYAERREFSLHSLLRRNSQLISSPARRHATVLAGNCCSKQVWAFFLFTFSFFEEKLPFIVFEWESFSPRSAAEGRSEVFWKFSNYLRNFRDMKRSVIGVGGRRWSSKEWGFTMDSIMKVSSEATEICENFVLSHRFHNQTKPRTHLMTFKFKL